MGEKNTLVVRSPCGCRVMMAVIDENTHPYARKMKVDGAIFILVSIPGSTAQMMTAEEAVAHPPGCSLCDPLQEHARVGAGKAVLAL